jgi:hypothetical protein
MSACFYLPADVVSQRLQSQPKFSFFPVQYQYRGALDVVRSIYGRHGIGGFYRGLLPHILAYAPSGAVYWGAYEGAKNMNYMIWNGPDPVVSAYVGFNEFLVQLSALAWLR